MLVFSMGDNMDTSFQYFWGLFLSLSLYFIHSTSTNHVHIVYLGRNQFNDPLLTTQTHLQLLSSVFSSMEEAKEALLYSYKRSFSGFSARLNSTQAAKLAKMEGVISIFKSRTLQLDTTRSWDFLGLPLEQSKGTPLPTNGNKVTPMQLAYGHDVVVGVFDTGIWPESKSFKEEPGMGPIPLSWRGSCCKKEKSFDPKKACNRKLIGARYYLKAFEDRYGRVDDCGKKEYRSPRDFLGHGTHTASTAVGSIVRDASFLGLGLGTARGGAPRARLAVYKVCWNVDNRVDGVCLEADILAAFDDALCDGVNVISVSISGNDLPLTQFFASHVDIGSFHATQLGINVVFSAGNNGPELSLVENVAPWSLCVAASTIDRVFQTQILLDKRFLITGTSLIAKPVMNTTLKEAKDYFRNGVCKSNYWTKRNASGRIILCFSISGFVSIFDAIQAVQNASASGLIFADSLTRQIPDVDFFPTILVDFNQGTQLKFYYNKSPETPVVEIIPTRTRIGQTPAPSVAYFSSRGPNSLVADILKPDIIAPGVNILAAWPPNTPPSSSSKDCRSVNWNFLSGTSMSCPHVAGVVALLKSAHPDWSPAAIGSAIMTTAYTIDTSLDNILDGGSAKHADPFDFGSGHLNPLKAMDPGLVYDLSTHDYITFFCNIGYTEEQIKRIVSSYPRFHINCSKRKKAISDLNYPSITVSNLQFRTTIKRTLRNVNRKGAIYFVNVVKPKGVKVVIWPKLLIFTCYFQQISYYVTLSPLKCSEGRYDFGEIVWCDGYHRVRSSLVVRVNNTGVFDDSTTHPSI